MTQRIDRRAFLAASTAAAASGYLTPALAQGWAPSKEVEFVIPFAPGGGSDQTVRIMHKIITDEKLTNAVWALNNRPGGSGASAIGYVKARKAGDAHTVVSANTSMQVAEIMNAQAVTLSELRPVARVMLDENLLYVKADAPWKTMQELVEHTKKSGPKTVSFASSGMTDTAAVTLLGRNAGIEFNIINFRGGSESLTNLLGGHVQSAVANPTEFMAQHKAGALRALGIFRRDRHPALKEVPTMIEQGIDVPSVQMWRGIMLPKDAPDAAVAYWESVFLKVAATKMFKDYVEENIGTEAPMGAADFAKFVAEEGKFYRSVLQKA